MLQSTTKTILFFLVVMIISSQGFSFQNRIVSHRSARHSTLNMMWDTKKMGGANAGTIEQKKIVHEEEETIKDFFRRTPPGSGADDRFPTFPKEKEQEIEHAKLSRIDQSLRQKTLKMSLEGNHFGSVDKLTLISQAINEGILSATTTKTASMSAGGLYKEWDMTI